MSLASRSAALLATALVSTACDLTAPWSSAPGDVISRGVALSATTLSFEGQVGFQQPDPQTVDVTGLGEGVWVRVLGEPTSPVDSVGIWGNNHLGIRPVAPETLGPGTYEGAVRLEACTTYGARACQPLGGGAGTITVRYVVKPYPISVSPDRFVFDQVAGAAPPPAQMVAIDGPADDGPWSGSQIGVVGFGGAWAWVDPSMGDSAPATAAIGVSRNFTFFGVESGQIRFVRKGMSAFVAVQRTVRAPEVTITSDPLVFTVREGEVFRGALPIVNIATEQDAALRYVVEPRYPTIDTPRWLSVVGSGMTPSSFSVGIDPIGLSVGTYGASLRIWGDYLGDRLLPVTLEVTPPLLAPSPGALAFSVRSATTPAEATADVVLSTTGPTLAWSAAATVPWLAVSPAAGTAGPGAPARLQVSLVPQALGSLSNGAHSGAVEVAGADTAGPFVVRVPVSLSLYLPRLMGVGPTQDVAGIQRDVLLVCQSPYGAPVPVFGSVPADGIVSVGGDKIVVRAPTLGPGTYAVTIPNALGVPTGAGTYRVSAPLSADRAAVDAPGSKIRVWFDDAAATLWSVNAGSGALERHSASTGWTRVALSLPGVEDAAPMPDASILSWSDSGVRFVDPATLVPTGSPADSTGTNWPDASGFVGPLIDGWAVLLGEDALGCPGCNVPYYTLDPSGPTLARGALWTARSVRALAWTRVGESFVAAIDPRVTGSTYTNLTRWFRRGYYEYASDHPSTAGGASAPFFVDRVALDRTGLRQLALRDGTSSPGDSALIERWPDRAVTVPGKLPDTIANAALTQDGSRAVAFDGVSRTVRTFDLSAPPDPGTGLFPELGTPGGEAPVADPGGGVVLALSADDRILFLGGDERIVVHPLP